MAHTLVSGISYWTLSWPLWAHCMRRVPAIVCQCASSLRAVPLSLAFSAYIGVQIIMYVALGSSPEVSLVMMNRP